MDTLKTDQFSNQIDEQNNHLVVSQSPSDDRSPSRSYDRSRSRSPMNLRKRSRSRSPRDHSRDRHKVRRYDNRNSARNAQLDKELGLKYRWEKTVFVSNLPFDLRWTELKDLVKSKIGEIMFCEVHDKGEGKSQGVASIEFKHIEDAEKAVDLMNGYEIGGRKITVRIDGEGFKTRQSKQISRDHKKTSSIDTHHHHHHSNHSHNNNHSSQTSSHQQSSSAASANQGVASILNLICNTLGTNQSTLLNQLAQQMKIEGPVTNRVFLASLDYRVDENKIREVFSLAGKINSVSLFRERDGKSRGMAVVEYSSEIEALNAISMFDRQVLNDRQMNVRFDTKPPLKDEEKSPTSSLPSGLKGIGTGLIPSSSVTPQPQIPKQQQQQQPEVNVGGLGIDINTLNALAATLTGGTSNLALSSLSALAGLAGLTGASNTQTNSSINSGLLATPQVTSPSKHESSISKVFIKNVS
jgi:RNA recognition motif-containing protein